LASEGRVCEKFNLINCCLQIGDQKKGNKRDHGWDPNDVFGGWFSDLGGFKTLIGSNGPNRRSMLNIALSGSPDATVYQYYYGGHYKKMATHKMMLWKYKPLDQGDAL
jgi:hypothetical protein